MASRQCANVNEQLVRTGKFGWSHASGNLPIHKCNEAFLYRCGLMKELDNGKIEELWNIQSCTCLTRASRVRKSWLHPSQRHIVMASPSSSAPGDPGSDPDVSVLMPPLSSSSRCVLSCISSSCSSGGGLCDSDIFLTVVVNSWLVLDIFGRGLINSSADWMSVTWYWPIAIAAFPHFPPLVKSPLPLKRQPPSQSIMRFSPRLPWQWCRAWMSCYGHWGIDYSVGVQEGRIALSTVW